MYNFRLWDGTTLFQDPDFHLTACNQNTIMSCVIGYTNNNIVLWLNNIITYLIL
jgi:hypothetical protein